MVAVFNKELLSWYLITLKLKETVETNLAIRQPEQTPSSTPLTVYNSDPEVELVSTPPPPPPPPQQALDSPWIISIREKLDQARQYESSSPWATLSIYRIPKSPRDDDDTAYASQIVSFGPYHRRRLRDMDRHKWCALHHALVRAGLRVRRLLVKLLRGNSPGRRRIWRGRVPFLVIQKQSSCFP